MKILNECNLAIVVSEILNGRTIVFPTETSYGLGCDASNQSSVDNIYKIKNRDPKKSLLVVVPTIEMAKEYLDWNETMEKIANKFWPGPLTVVGKFSGIKKLAKGVVADDGTVAVRVSKFPLLVSITEKLGRPLVATSANVSGPDGDIYDSKNILQIFEKSKNQPDIIMNQGILPENKPTTIIKIVESSFVVLRQGELKVQL